MILKMTENTFFKECEHKRKEVAKLESKMFILDQTLFNLKYNSGPGDDSNSIAQVQYIGNLNKQLLLLISKMKGK